MLESRVPKERWRKNNLFIDEVHGQMSRISFRISTPPEGLTRRSTPRLRTQIVRVIQGRQNYPAGQRLSYGSPRFADVAEGSPTGQHREPPLVVVVFPGEKFF